MPARMGELRFLSQKLLMGFLLLCCFANVQTQGLSTQGSDLMHALPFKSSQAKLLVLSSVADSGSLSPFLSMLESRRLAYEHKVAGQQSLQWSDLVEGDEGRYRGIILLSAHLTDPETRLSALTPEEWALLQRYELEYRARRLVLSFDPNLSVDDYGVRFAYAVDASRNAMTLSATEEAYRRLGLRAGSSLGLQDVYVSLLRLEPHDGQLVSPLLVDSSGHAAAVLSVAGDGREALLISMTQVHQLLTNHQLLSAALAWVARQAPLTGLSSERSWWQEYRVVIVLVSIAALALFIALINWYRQRRMVRALLYKPALRDEAAKPQKKTLSQLK